MNRRLERLQAKMGLSYQIMVGLILALWLLLLGYSSVQPRTYNFTLNRVADITVRENFANMRGVESLMCASILLRLRTSRLIY